MFFKVKILSLNCPMKSSLRHWLYLVLYGCEVSAFSVGQLTVAAKGWREATRGEDVRSSAGVASLAGCNWHTMYQVYML